MLTRLFLFLGILFALFLVEASLCDVGSESNDCPNSRFVAKHMCTDCHSEKDALEFSIKRNLKYPTSLNTVFVGNSTFSLNHNGHCVNTSPMMAFNCRTNLGSCVVKGNRCTGPHHAGNGHLYYNEITCE